MKLSEPQPFAGFELEMLDPSDKPQPTPAQVEELEFELIPEGELQINRFAGSEVRKVLHDHEWFFCVVDVVAALTESTRPTAYWSDLKTKLAKNEGFSELYGKIEKLPLRGKDGVSRPAEAQRQRHLPAEFLGQCLDLAGLSFVQAEGDGARFHDGVPPNVIFLQFILASVA